MNRMKRILITGGAGFIGYHLAHQLCRSAGNHIVLLDDFSRGRYDNDLQALVSNSNVDLISGDITDPATYEIVGEGYDEVYHLAALIGVRNVVRHPEEVLKVNLVSTVLLLEWFTQGGGRKLLFSSTSESYAWTQQFFELPIPTPEDIPLSLTDLRNPRSTYAASKIFGELAVTQYCTVRDKPFVILRLHNVYGPRMGYDHVVPELYQRAAAGENPLIVYSANHSRAFCYVTDAVTAMMLSMSEPSAIGLTFNVGNDREEVTIAELALTILDEAEIHADIEPRVDPNDPIVRRCPDISRARDVLGYEPEITLDDGISNAITWYAERRMEIDETV